MRQWKFLALSAAFACMAACGGSSGGDVSTNPGGPGNPPPPPPPSNTVTLANQLFTPASLTVTKGTTVTWYWNDCGGTGGYGGVCVTHSVVFDDGSSGSPLQDSGTFTRTFNDAGTFKYHCGVHGSAMTGQIVVN